jgi:UDPglucose 6-dehydrogenase
VNPAPVSKKVCVIGSGYVGLTTAVCFAHLGHDVTCTDIDADRVARLSAGECPILEHGLPELLAEGLASGRLDFSTDNGAAAAAAEFTYLCVPTPQGDDGSADLSYIQAAATEIGPHVEAGSVVVNKSTVPVGSTLVVERALGRSDVFVVSNPEFLREGTAVHDFLHPDRVVVGAADRSAAMRVAELYDGIGATLIITDPPSAETIKYAANAFLATKLSFVNAVAAVCEAVGADMNDVVVGIGSDRRIGHEFLKPGPGWGGSCFPKDSRALVRIAEDAGYKFDLLEGVIAVNLEQFDRVAARAVEMVGGSVAGATLAVWGLTFKARTDDLRDSPSLEVIARLRAAGAHIRAYDPSMPDGEVPASKAAVLDGIDVVADPYDACDGAALLLVLTEWDEFRWLDIESLGDRLAERRILDGRNLLDREALIREGFAYRGIGRA